MFCSSTQRPIPTCAGALQRAVASTGAYLCELQTVGHEQQQHAQKQLSGSAAGNAWDVCSRRIAACMRNCEYSASR